ncbi:MAG: S24/S26 family peptidase [Ruminococcus sp.]|uniref:S24/S26 family peptidase n=1 Tax=Ruminococcus sp. TaxID=41978 RepID=UPI001B6254E5|nr:S24/S26 family peptidase [Ruminococcus sp.]MBO4493376.1 S24/S26 family peptidase [Ruminococcus sp.]MBP5433101.1 S24/S26 family peptidase [Ruminococcus sp.]
MGRAQLEQLEKHGSYLSVPSGISMRPMIRGGRDAVLVKKLTKRPKRYDLVMYVRPDMQGVIHRVVRYENGRYIIIGDNCWQFERVSPEQIKGIVTEFCRKGKWHRIDETLYRLYVHVWVDFLFVKRPLFYVRDKLRRLIKR